MRTSQPTGRTPNALAASTAVSEVWLGGVALVGILYYSVAVVAVHIIRSDLDPTIEAASQYAIGSYAYLMTSAFVAIGCGVLALAAGLYRTLSPTPRRGVVLLGIGPWPPHLWLCSPRSKRTA